MAANDTLEVPSFETHEDEVKFWRERYLEVNVKCQELEEKFQELGIKYRRLESCHMCTNEDPEHPVKIDYITMDPLVKLEEPIAHKIMKYLSGKELLEAIEVSPGWKRFIEERPSLMNRAMDQVVVKPSLEGWSIPLIKDTFIDDAFGIRPYRHMKSSVWIKMGVKIFSVARYAASLETLKIPFIEGCFECDRNEDAYRIEGNVLTGCEFPKLKELIINQENAILFFKNCTFPAVTKLKFSTEGNSESLRDILRRFPNLKVLKLCYFNDREDLSKIKADESQPKIEKAKLLRDNLAFLTDQQQSLQELEIGSATDENFRWLLRNLKKLKVLKMAGVYFERQGEVEFPQNEFIQTLNIGKLHERGQSNSFPAARTNSILRSFMTALPNLIEFETRITITAELLQIIASHATNLKKLIYNGFEDMDGNVMKAYRNLRKNPRQNSEFELICIPRPCYQADSDSDSYKSESDSDRRNDDSD